MSIGSGAPGTGQKQYPSALPAHGFGLRDGCWNQVSSGGTDPRGVDAQSSGGGRRRSC
ncbi:hypothetical protein HMPREF1979_01663 [Actinomyces johnsonii F0542]|uniref:Uncharacterized protein n=1 Tax=Actinomyces johnsonii F0542 TaxID=1321818 RepID=U1Q7H5_9ACTO|nr:hypothetical protein HMPREF1979_01663 [Actinomyces johnsonii F0542]